MLMGRSNFIAGEHVLIVITQLKALLTIPINHKTGADLHISPCYFSTTERIHIFIFSTLLA